MVVREQEKECCEWMFGCQWRTGVMRCQYVLLLRDETTSWKKSCCVWWQWWQVRTQWRGTVTISDRVNNFQLMVSVGLKAILFAVMGNYYHIFKSQSDKRAVIVMVQLKWKKKILGIYIGINIHNLVQLTHSRDSVKKPKVIEEILYKTQFLKTLNRQLK